MNFSSQRGANRIKTKELARFSMGNKEVISSQYYAAKRKATSKGQELGFSDLVVWNQEGAKKDYHFYVVSKREQLTNFQLANDFKSLGLEVKAMAYELLVKGNLRPLEDLRLFNLYMKRTEQTYKHGALSNDLQRELIARIYIALRPKSTKLICSPVETNIECRLPRAPQESPTFEKTKDKYSVIFVPNTVKALKIPISKWS